MSPNKVSDGVSDPKIEILVMNECFNVGDDNKEKDT